MIKTNVTTKQSGTLRMAGSSDAVRFDKLVTDKSGNLYTIKSDDSNRNDFIESMAKIDPKTGAVTVLKRISIKDYNYLDKLRYSAATNEIVGLESGSRYRRLYKLNLTTNESASIEVTSQELISLPEMVVDRKRNAIIQSADFATSPNYIENYIQINLATGAQTTLAPITQYTPVLQHPDLFTRTQ